MGMVDSTLDREELYRMSQQANTDFLPAESPASSASTPSDRGQRRVLEPKNAKRKKDQETVEQELLKHLNTKMTVATPRINHSHLFLNAFEKMRVNLAFHLFSEEVERDLHLYHEQIQGARGNHEGTLQLHKRIST
ncbi:hypothetical protein IscW_ISCW011490 [Ixodes scapularis]|uniref:Uncharacterized protein n=1 Tax=Ixodes scapularis TaxID=6945 RepID=B7Q795_IXOSC|nr:hypothetical protein IscW_ISCW011490 [Ixodes scapularis]|eukprot:XP_002412133.1 hypothetical protein IscW_ISCW011490 [Ixodes scapularis]